MQVNLHCSPCIPRVLLYSSSHRKKIYHQECTKICHFDPKIPKKLLFPPQTPFSVGRGTPPPHTQPLSAFGASTRLAPLALDFASLQLQLLDPLMAQCSSSCVLCPKTSLTRDDAIRPGCRRFSSASRSLSFCPFAP